MPNQITKEDFYDSLLKKKKQKNTLNKLFQPPTPETFFNSTTFSKDMSPNIYHHADLLETPNDRNYEYLLVVVDQATRLVDAVPLKNKTSETVANAFKQIYEKNDILEYPHFLKVDNGGEFKRHTQTLMNQHKTIIKRGLAGRHRQQALAERKNKTIGTMIHKKIAHDELQTGQASSQWVADLPLILNAINKKVKQSIDKINKQPKTEMDYAPRVMGDAQKLLKVGDKVRRILDEPRNVNQQDKLSGKFRSSDQRWSKETYTIRFVLLKPNQPPMYMLDNLENVAYTKNQLQPIKREKESPQVIIEEEPVEEPIEQPQETRMVVKKILERQTINNRYWYKILWSDKTTSWESKAELKKDINRLLTLFDNKLLKQK